jgi:hypothetical protein
LTADQLQQLPTLLAQGAEAYGFLGEVWTTKRVATVIRTEFRVSYHPAHVSRLLRQIGWSVQMPIRRATQRDEQAIQTWQQERLLCAFGKAREEERTVVWVDESGFYPLPAVVRTYAPRGQTPVLRAPLTRDHLSIISGITSAGRLLVQNAGGALSRTDGGRLPAPSAAPSRREAAGAIGRSADSPGTAGQSLPGHRTRAARLTGAAARVCAGGESR